VLGEVLSRIEQGAGLEHHYFEPAFRQHFRGSPSCGPRADDADVVHFLRTNDLKHGWFTSVRSLCSCDDALAKNCMHGCSGRERHLESPTHSCLGFALSSYVMSTGTRNQILERRVRQLLLLQETAKKVNSILDLEKLLDEIVGGVAEAFGCNRTAVLLKDDARNDLEMIALRGFSSVHLKGYRFKVGGEGMVGHVSATAKMRYAPDVRKDPYYVVSESTTLSEVDIPLISRGKLIGIFNAQNSAVDAFSPEQIDLLCALADNIAIAIENARLFRQERLEKEKALRDQAEARQIQRALLPEQEPVISGYAMDGFCLQLNAVGGDWYDYLDLGDGLWGIALGDVCGKGMAAALLMSATRSLFRMAAEGWSPPRRSLGV
jgi:GAF domain/Stage II sporulation protein E (SpoIIE)